MPITEADIQKIAALAHLEITDEELHTLAPQVASIVAYVEQLSQLDTSAVEPAIGGLTPEGERTDAARKTRRAPRSARRSRSNRRPTPRTATSACPRSSRARKRKRTSERFPRPPHFIQS